MPIPSNPVVDPRPCPTSSTRSVPHAGTLASSLPPPSAPSEISSSDFNSAMPPEELLHGFRQHVARKQWEPSAKSQSRGTSTANKKLGLLSQYGYKQGTQYYKDLAGNIKEGPIGFAPVCRCGPQLKKLEKRMDADRHNLYDHIDSSTRNLAQRLDTLDQRCAQQIHSVDRMTRERLAAECRGHEELIRVRTAEEAQRMQGRVEQHVDARFTTLERRFRGHTDGCDWCLTGDEDKQHYHRDDMLNQRFCYEAEEPPPPGRLFRSRSDDTLSLASSHPSRRHWRMKGSSRDVRDNASAAAERASRIERKLRHRARKEQQQREREEQEAPQPAPYFEEAHTGRTPDGASPAEPPQQARMYGSLPRRKNSSDLGSVRQRGSSVDRALPIPRPNQMQVDVQVHQAPPPSSASHQPAPPLPPPRSVSHSVGLNTKLTDVNQNYNNPKGLTTASTSPERVMRPQNSKTDTGSNPDSGYGSRIYGRDPKTGQLVGSTGSSFQSSSPDPHNSSVGTNTSLNTEGSSPGFYYTDHHRFRQPIHTSPASNPTSPTVPVAVKDWFDRQTALPAVNPHRPQNPPFFQQMYSQGPQHYAPQRSAQPPGSVPIGNARRPSGSYAGNIHQPMSRNTKESCVEIGKATQV